MSKKHHAITFSAGSGFGITGIFAWIANIAEASQTGVGASDPDAFASNTDRVEVLVAANMDCTVVLFIDQTNE